MLACVFSVFFSLFGGFSHGSCFPFFLFFGRPSRFCCWSWCFPCVPLWRSPSSCRSFPCVSACVVPHSFAVSSSGLCPCRWAWLCLPCWFWFPCFVRWVRPSQFWFGSLPCLSLIVASGVGCASWHSSCHLAHFGVCLCHLTFCCFCVVLFGVFSGGETLPQWGKMMRMPYTKLPCGMYQNDFKTLPCAVFY